MMMGLRGWGKGMGRNRIWDRRGEMKENGTKEGGGEKRRSAVLYCTVFLKMDMTERSMLQSQRICCWSRKRHLRSLCALKASG